MLGQQGEWSEDLAAHFAVKNRQVMAQPAGVPPNLRKGPFRRNSRANSVWSGVSSPRSVLCLTGTAIPVRRVWIPVSPKVSAPAPPKEATTLDLHGPHLQASSPEGIVACCRDGPPATVSEGGYRIRRKLVFRRSKTLLSAAHSPPICVRRHSLFRAISTTNPTYFRHLSATPCRLLRVSSSVDAVEIGD